MRTILHSDCNSFYASVECASDPSLRGKAVAVCGDPKERHGIILAKSDPAKKCGVRTGETIGSALEKCPNLILLPPDGEKYVYYSRRMRAMYAEYTSQVEPFGLDESWLDVSDHPRSGMQIASELRRRAQQIALHHVAGHGGHQRHAARPALPDDLSGEGEEPVLAAAHHVRLAQVGGFQSVKGQIPPPGKIAIVIGAALGAVQNDRRIVNLRQRRQIARDLAVHALLMVHRRRLRADQDPVALVFVKRIQFGCSPFRNVCGFQFSARPTFSTNRA